MPSPILEIQTPIVADLSPGDQRLLQQLESRVESGMMEFARALHEIRTYKDGLLWKTNYESFEEYAQARFSYQKQHAYRLAAAGGFVSKLDTQSPSAPKPLRESQIRPIINKLPEEHHIPFWENITIDRPPSELTTEFVTAEVAKYQKSLPSQERRPEKKTKPPKRDRPAADEIAREKSFEAIRKLKLAASDLPRFAEISDLLDKVSELVGRKS